MDLSLGDKGSTQLHALLSVCEQNDTRAVNTDRLQKSDMIGHRSLCACVIYLVIYELKSFSRNMVLCATTQLYHSK